MVSELVDAMRYAMEMKPERDRKNVRDALLEAGHPPEEVEDMLGAANGTLQLRVAEQVRTGLVRVLLHRAREMRPWEREGVEYFAEVIGHVDLAALLSTPR